MAVDGADAVYLIEIRFHYNDFIAFVEECSEHREDTWMLIE
jgi:hypothetical protein